MTRHLLRMCAVAALACAGALSAAPGASADATIAVDIVAKHSVTWDYTEDGYSDDCASWTKGSGKQTMLVHSDRRERLRLEHAFGRWMLTGKTQGTFESTLVRNGSWDIHTPEPRCTPCGPNSEYGECGPEPTKPKPLRFDCGERKLRGAVARVSYPEVGIPRLSTGLIVRAWPTRDDSFENCPPNLPKGLSGVSLRNQWPEWEKLADLDTARLTRMKPGDSVTAEVLAERTYYTDGYAAKEGKDCGRIPRRKDGHDQYAECAVTKYVVTLTRID